MVVTLSLLFSLIWIFVHNNCLFLTNEAFVKHKVLQVCFWAGGGNEKYPVLDIAETSDSVILGRTAL